MSTLDMPQPDNADDLFRNLSDAFNGLFECMWVGDIQTYSAISSSLWLSIIKGRYSVLSPSTKAALVKYIDVHDLLFVCLKLIHLRGHWNNSVATQLKIFALKMSQGASDINHQGDIIIKSEVGAVLGTYQIPQLKEAYTQASGYVIGLKWIPAQALRFALPLAFTYTVKMINAHKVLLRPIDEDINKVTAEELLERIIQVEAELERIAAG